MAKGYQIETLQYFFMADFIAEVQVLRMSLQDFKIDFIVDTQEQEVRAINQCQWWWRD